MEAWYWQTVVSTNVRLTPIGAAHPTCLSCLDKKVISCCQSKHSHRIYKYIYEEKPKMYYYCTQFTLLSYPQIINTSEISYILIEGPCLLM